MSGSCGKAETTVATTAYGGGKQSDLSVIQSMMKSPDQSVAAQGLKLWQHHQVPLGENGLSAGQFQGDSAPNIAKDDASFTTGVIRDNILSAKDPSTLLNDSMYKPGGVDSFINETGKRGLDLPVAKLGASSPIPLVRDAIHQSHRILIENGMSHQAAASAAYGVAHQYSGYGPDLSGNLVMGAGQ
jgi:hypothetical protein